MLAKIFFNSDEKRLRAGWRILLFLLMLVGVSIAGQLIIKAAFGGVPKTSPYVRSTILFGIVAISASLAVPIARRCFDRKSITSLGLAVNREAVGDIFFGFVLSGMMAGCVFLLMYATGLIQVTGINWSNSLSIDNLATMSVTSLALFFLIDALVSWWEELVFRGYLLQNMIEGIGQWLAIAVSCLVYGLVHLSNPNAGWLSGAIIIAFGFLRVYGYLSTRQLWLSLGMHLGWNFFQGPVFGYAASGQETATIIEQHPTGPDWLSGGAFGPEGSVLILPILVLALLAMRWWANRTSCHSTDAHERRNQRVARSSLPTS